MKKIAILTLTTLAIAACSHTLTKNQSFILPNRNATQVKQAILKGCADRGWFCKETALETIEGTLVYKNRYMVTVSIPYSDNGYEINYKESHLLNPNKETTYTVSSFDSSYDSWVFYLDKSIKKAALEQGWTE